MTDPSPAETAPPRPRRRLLRYLPVLVIALLFAAVIGSGVLKHISLDDLRQHRAELIAFVRAHPIGSLAAFCAADFLVVVACVPGPSILSMTGGFLFGPWLGGAAAMVALTAGASVVFAACRTAFGDWAARRGGGAIARIEAGFSRDAFSYLMALRLMPVAPFFLVNLAAGLARVRYSHFLIATAVGAAPSVFIFAGLGAGFGEVFRRNAPLDTHFLARPEVALPLGGLALLSLAPAAWRFWRARRARAAA